MAQYATSEEAAAYFADRLHSEVWDAADTDNRTKALKTATVAIDRLRFVGQRHAVYVAVQAGATAEAILASVATQVLEFPRDSDEEIPQDIKNACCEEALALLDGKDPDQELEDLAVISQGYSSVRVTVDRSFTQEHLNAGIVSPRAWRFLKPYLAESRSFKINRV
jgi:hypothetical protein